MSTQVENHKNPPDSPTKKNIVTGTELDLDDLDDMLRIKR